IAQGAAENIATALATYTAMEQMLATRFVAQKQLIVCSKNSKEQQVFEAQITSENVFAQSLLPAEMSAMKQLLVQEWGIGKVSPVSIIDASVMLAAWQKYLLQKGCYRAEQYDFAAMSQSVAGIGYKDVRADKIIFCEGAIGRANSYFPHQQFTQNRGEALLLSIPGLSAQYLYHKGIRLVPRSDGLWWCGSNYVWQYENLLPNKEWRLQTEKELSTWLKLPCETVNHLVAERPTTAGQLPILMQHATIQNLYFFNGLGTRGFSAGPRLAKEMAALVML
ncbi:MAG: hypothetical protein IT256_05550, partial [Chitinophagaceae bacterium]|nr:hypothetical protein [Chitinophagaceae bacterium]